MSRKTENIPLTSNLVYLGFILVIFTLFLQETAQQNIISKTADVQGLCNYRYDPKGRYTCDLYDVNITSRFDSLEIISNHLPDHTDDSVKAVIFQNGEVRFLNSEIMKKFKNLEYLEINGKNLQEITENAFEVCEKLQELWIWFNPLTTFQNGAFKNCTNLKVLSAMTLRLNTIPGDLFGATTNLEEFYITSNELTSLPGSLLQNMTKLRNVYIDGNYLTNLSSNFLSNVVNLEKFSIWSNRFQDPLPIMNILNRHINLKEIYLSMNSFTTFNFSFFEKFQKLEILWIGTTSGPKLTNISWQSLPKSLLSLVAEGIGEEIPENSFNQLTNLKSLKLSGSSITNIQRDTFRPLTQLLSLSIQYTNIKSLNPLIFMNLVNLSDLNLSNNKIEELPFEIFGPLRNLGRQSREHGIRMSSNQIQRLNSNSFGRHPFMSSLSFAGNRINSIERGIFSRFNSTIAEADFRLNLCINLTFNSTTNLDFFGDFERCYQNWEAGNATTPLTTVTTVPSTSTTPGGCGNNFKEFEVFVIIFVGFVKVLMNFIK